MKRFFLFTFLFILISAPVVDAFDVSADCACLMVQETGEILYEKNSKTKHSIASTTKIMTGIIALENGNVNEVVTVSSNAATQEGSSIYLKEGDQIILNDLLYGMLLNSGNDAACAVAEHISGSVEDFANLMTKRAIEIGAVNTVFKNPNGLDEEGHFSTAEDLAIITAYSLENQKFKEIVSTKNNQITVGSNICYLKNHNKLLWNYDGCVGVKTGYTKKTGRCLVSAAQRDGITLIAVTLDAPDDWNDHKEMLDYGFSVCSKKLIIKKGEVLKNYKKFGGFNAVSLKEVSIPVGDKNINDKEIVLHLIKEPKNNIMKNEKIGYAEVFINNKKISTVDLVSDKDIIIRKDDNQLFAFINILKELLIKFI